MLIGATFFVRKTPTKCYLVSNAKIIDRVSKSIDSNTKCVPKVIPDCPDSEVQKRMDNIKNITRKETGKIIKTKQTKSKNHLRY